jgi:hypothetical protein
VIASTSSSGTEPAPRPWTLPDPPNHQGESSKVSQVLETTVEAPGIEPPVGRYRSSMRLDPLRFVPTRPSQVRESTRTATNRKRLGRFTSGPPRGRRDCPCTGPHARRRGGSVAHGEPAGGGARGEKRAAAGPGRPGGDVGPAGRASIHSEVRWDHRIRSAGGTRRRRATLRNHTTE